MEQIFLWEILVPTVRNNGRPFRTRYHRIWDAKVRSIAGGLSILKPLKGQWLSKERELFSERMIPVRIACSESAIDTIANLTAAYYAQKAIMYYLVSTKVVIKHYV